MKILVHIVPVLFFSLLLGCREIGNDFSKDTGFPQHVSVQDQRFLDTLGRDLILHGINLVNKNPDVNYLGKNDQVAISKMRSWGFNCIRLGVIWDGLEPEPGRFDEEYLKGIDERISWAEENGIYVYLDMHQDLYSVKFSDGAPEWATLDEGKPHLTGEVWSESYFISPAVQTAFDNFWKNEPAPDGVGVQDHFIKAWKHLAERYADNITVIGFDLMNEPFMGSGATRMRELQLKAYAEMLTESGEQLPDTEELIRMLETKEGRIKIFEDLIDSGKFKRIVDAVYPIQEPFESGVLMDFYQRTRDTIRKVNKHHIIFLEHGIFSNSGLLSAIRPLVDKNGHVDSLVAYAPHGYDLVTDTEYQEASSFDRLNFIFERIETTADRLNMPVIIGEWGAFYSNEHPAVVAQADHILSIYEKKLFSDSYWSYFNELDKMPYFEVLKKPYPMAVNGRLMKYEYLFATGELTTEWIEDGDRSNPSMFYIPDIGLINEQDLEITPESGYEFEKIEGGPSGYLFIEPVKESINRKIYLRADMSDHIGPSG